MENNDSIWRSEDIAVASFLLARGAIFVGLTSNYPGHFLFQFEDYNKCESFKKDYLNNGLAPARELFSRREELLSEIKNWKSTGGFQ